MRALHKLGIVAAFAMAALGLPSAAHAQARTVPCCSSTLHTTSTAKRSLVKHPVTELGNRSSSVKSVSKYKTPVKVAVKKNVGPRPALIKRATKATVKHYPSTSRTGAKTHKPPTD